MLAVPDRVCCNRRVVAVSLVSAHDSNVLCTTYLTCSLTSCVVPAWSSHLPMKSSPRKGLRGFFSLPSFSLLLAYCCFSVLKNHLSTSAARLAGSFSAAGATNSEGCSVQYEENSVRDVVERMKAGAVIDERSPLKDAIDCLDSVQAHLANVTCCAATNL